MLGVPILVKSSVIQATYGMPGWWNTVQRSVGCPLAILGWQSELVAQALARLVSFPVLTPLMGEGLSSYSSEASHGERVEDRPGQSVAWQSRVHQR